ncbi:MAG: MAE_28990/MAE_18760 family HEPN-like nuclease [Saprospiraceae bacterium]
MIDAINDFNDTKIEINKYFDFLEKVDGLNIGVPFIHYPINPSIPSYKIDEEVSKILKANAFLMLYNLTEATIKNGIWELLTRVESEQIPYKDLKEELKNIWLDRKLQIEFKSKDNAIVKQLSKVIESVLNNTLIFYTDKKQIKFESGNLNIDTIKKTAKLYGFAKVDEVHTNQKEAFKKVKAERNNLAHGDKTFSDCGNDYSFNDLKNYKDYVFDYLERVLQSIETFINDKGYKQITLP